MDGQGIPQSPWPMGLSTPGNSCNAAAITVIRIAQPITRRRFASRQHRVNGAALFRRCRGMFDPMLRRWGEDLFVEPRFAVRAGADMERVPAGGAIRGGRGSGMESKGSCHCGGVRIWAARLPEWVGQCNCSICTKLNWQVAYYPPGEVRVAGETATYVWGDRLLRLHHCPVCGCTTHWDALPEALARGDLEDEVREALESKMGVNARLLDGFDEAAVEVRVMDNAG